MWDKIQNHFWKDFSLYFSQMVLKSILHGQMTEKIASEVRPKKGKKLQKVFFFKAFFWPLGAFGGQKNFYHMKFKSKISYLGKNISILPWLHTES